MAGTPKPRPTVGAVRRSFAPWNDPNAVPLIRFEGVTKAFGDFVAVDNISLDIYEREFFALLGPSGCGKTTLMRMLAGFEEPTQGRVTLGGQDMVGIPPHRRPANMMFQSYALFPHMNVAENIAFGLKMDGMAKPDIKTRVDEMLGLVKLEKFAARKPHQLSGGQRQRVALARSLAKKPKVLLLDEPLGALDKKLREETQFELMDLQVQLGMTFLIVTHDQDEAMTVADRIAVMDQGKIVQIAPPAQMYEQPSCRYVAGFLGDINLFEAKVTAIIDGALDLAVNDCDSHFTVGYGDTLTKGDNVWLAIRPEKMRIAQDVPPENTPNVIAGTVWDIGYLGDWTTYLVEIEGGMKVRVARANASRFVERPISWDDKVWIHFAPDSGVVLTS
jgi:putrescine transport system ATP-binding protein